MVHALASTVHAHAHIIHTQNKIWDPRLKSGGFWSRSQEVGETTAAVLPAAPHCEGAKAQDLGTPGLLWTLSSFSPRARRLLKNPFRKVEAKPIEAQGLSGSALGLGFCSQDLNESQAQYQAVITCPC